jgi:hypothetical protein
MHSAASGPANGLLVPVAATGAWPRYSAENTARVTVASSGASRRDPRIDVLRGVSLLMIFVDHIPNNVLGRVTLHNFGFADAAEVFVLLAGVSSMLAYGRGIDRDGWGPGLRRLALRCGRIYIFQVILLLATLAIVQVWTGSFHQQPTIVDPILRAPGIGLFYALTLLAQPTYLDILPLYVVLLGAFPLVYLAVRRSPWLALGGSAALWMLAGFDHGLNLPNWIGTTGWYFNPFAWQFLFTLGAVLPRLLSKGGGNLPFARWLAWACGAYLCFAFLEAAPWASWHLPNLQPFAIGPLDKSHLAWPRILDILALFYLLFSSKAVRSFAASRWLRPLELCGRHSLEVFTTGCLLALIGRLVFRTGGGGVEMQIVVNVIGLGVMMLTGFWRERAKVAAAGAPAPLGGIPIDRRGHWRAIA